MTLPDFLIAGVPKAGTTALHGALDNHPELLLSKVKEPKYFLCDDQRPRRENGPGDAHSRKEWIWRRDRYEALFDGPRGLLRGESTPFYLYDTAAQRRIARLLPAARLIVVVRDPVDRAYSNWLHLWSDGLEPVSDFRRACELEDERIRAEWGRFWHYRRVGLYGNQLERLLESFPRQQIHVLRYRDVVETPAHAVDEVCAFLGVTQGTVHEVPAENTRGYVDWSTRSPLLRSTLRVGASAGAWFPPQVWRKASAPLLRSLQRQSAPRPEVAPEDRRRLVEFFEADIKKFGALLGRDFSDWLGDHGAGEFSVRKASPGRSHAVGPTACVKRPWLPSGRQAS